MTMKWMPVALAFLLPTAALAQNPFAQLGSAAASAGKTQLEKRLNEKLLTEAQKNQCSFKSGTDELAPGCDTKLRRLANVLIDAKKQLSSAQVGSYKFEVSGHTDSTGDAAKNKALSEKRAQAIVKELAARGVPQEDIIAVGYGSEHMLVKPDNTAAKKAKNRRYELRVRL